MRGAGGGRGRSTGGGSPLLPVRVARVPQAEEPQLDVRLAHLVLLRVLEDHALAQISSGPALPAHAPLRPICDLGELDGLAGVPDDLRVLVHQLQGQDVLALLRVKDGLRDEQEEDELDLQLDLHALRDLRDEHRRAHELRLLAQGVLPGQSRAAGLLGLPLLGLLGVVLGDRRRPDFVADLGPDRRPDAEQVGVGIGLVALAEEQLLGDVDLVHLDPHDDHAVIAEAVIQRRQQLGLHREDADRLLAILVLGEVELGLRADCDRPEVLLRHGLHRLPLEPRRVGPPLAQGHRQLLPHVEDQEEVHLGLDLAHEVHVPGFVRDGEVQRGLQAAAAGAVGAAQRLRRHLQPEHEDGPGLPQQGAVHALLLGADGHAHHVRHHQRRGDTSMDDVAHVLAERRVLQALGHPRELHLDVRRVQEADDNAADDFTHRRVLQQRLQPDDEVAGELYPLDARLDPEARVGQVPAEAGQPGGVVRQLDLGAGVLVARQLEAEAQLDPSVASGAGPAGVRRVHDLQRSELRRLRPELEPREPELLQLQELLQPRQLRHLGLELHVDAPEGVLDHALDLHDELGPDLREEHVQPVDLPPLAHRRRRHRHALHHRAHARPRRLLRVRLMRPLHHRLRGATDEGLLLAALEVRAGERPGVGPLRPPRLQQSPPPLHVRLGHHGVLLLDALQVHRHHRVGGGVVPLGAVELHVLLEVLLVRERGPGHGEVELGPHLAQVDGRRAPADHLALLVLEPHDEVQPRPAVPALLGEKLGAPLGEHEGDHGLQLDLQILLLLRFAEAGGRAVGLRADELLLGLGDRARERRAPVLALPAVRHHLGKQLHGVLVEEPAEVDLVELDAHDGAVRRHPLRRDVEPLEVQLDAAALLAGGLRLQVGLPAVERDLLPRLLQELHHEQRLGPADDVVELHHAPVVDLDAQLLLAVVDQEVVRVLRALPLRVAALHHRGGRPLLGGEVHPHVGVARLVLEEVPVDARQASGPHARDPDHADRLGPLHHRAVDHLFVLRQRDADHVGKHEAALDHLLDGALHAPLVQSAEGLVRQLLDAVRDAPELHGDLRGVQEVGGHAADDGHLLHQGVQPQHQLALQPQLCDAGLRRPAGELDVQVLRLEHHVQVDLGPSDLDVLGLARRLPDLHLQEAGDLLPQVELDEAGIQTSQHRRKVRADQVRVAHHLRDRLVHLGPELSDHAVHPLELIAGLQAIP
mmetsp:Transcript_55059/g.141758  ORF Transcript_55059/g.141758 Transcript_55059/m.141758 type:complete len:1209 (-) Transcript_55059:122-3748(-)